MIFLWCGHYQNNQANHGFCTRSWLAPPQHLFVGLSFLWQMAITVMDTRIHSLTTIASIYLLLYKGVAPSVSRVSTTALSVSSLSDDMKSSESKEIEAIQEKWNSVRFLSAEEAESLEPEWKEAYDRFHQKYEDDMARMMEITAKLQKMIEPPRVEKKSKGQRKRDAYAKVLEREAARAAAAKK